MTSWPGGSAQLTRYSMSCCALGSHSASPSEVPGPKLSLVSLLRRSSAMRSTLVVSALVVSAFMVMALLVTPRLGPAGVDPVHWPQPNSARLAGIMMAVIAMMISIIWR